MLAHAAHQEWYVRHARTMIYSLGCLPATCLEIDLWLIMKVIVRHARTMICSLGRLPAT